MRFRCNIFFLEKNLYNVREIRGFREQVANIKGKRTLLRSLSVTLGENAEESVNAIRYQASDISNALLEVAKTFDDL